MIEKNGPVNVTYDEVSVVGRTRTPSVLITVRPVEDPPSL